MPQEGGEPSGGSVCNARTTGSACMHLGVFRTEDSHRHELLLHYQMPFEATNVRTTHGQITCPCFASGDWGDRQRLIYHTVRSTMIGTLPSPNASRMVQTSNGKV